MSLAKKFRWFPVPGYGVCGGADRSCARRNMDPMDKLFDTHDEDMAKASEEADPWLRKALEAEADRKLREGLKGLKKADFEQIPAWRWKWPFFQRAYARLYRWCAVKAFED